MERFLKLLFGNDITVVDVSSIQCIESDLANPTTVSIYTSLIGPNQIINVVSSETDSVSSQIAFRNSIYNAIEKSNKTLSSKNTFIEPIFPADITIESVKVGSRAIAIYPGDQATDTGGLSGVTSNTTKSLN
jgi:hypothetical protein